MLKVPSWKLRIVFASHELQLGFSGLLHHTIVSRSASPAKGSEGSSWAGGGGSWGGGGGDGGGGDGGGGADARGGQEGGPGGAARERGGGVAGECARRAQLTSRRALLRDAACAEQRRRHS